MSRPFRLFLGLAGAKRSGGMLGGRWVELTSGMRLVDSVSACKTACFCMTVDKLSGGGDESRMISIEDEDGIWLGSIFDWRGL